MQGLGNALCVSGFRGCLVSRERVNAKRKLVATRVHNSGCCIGHPIWMVSRIDGIAKSRMLEKLQPHASLEGDTSW